MKPSRKTKAQRRATRKFNVRMRAVGRHRQRTARLETTIQLTVDEPTTASRTMAIFQPLLVKLVRKYRKLKADFESISPFRVVDRERLLKAAMATENKINKLGFNVE